MTVNPSATNVTCSWQLSGSWASGGSVASRLLVNSSGVTVNGGLLVIPPGGNAAASTLGAVEICSGGAYLVGDQPNGNFYLGTNGNQPTSASTANFSVSLQSVIGGIITNWGTSATQAIGFSVTTGQGVFQKLTSSRRYKKDITGLSFESSKIYELSAKEFTWKENDKRDFGGIAEEVAAILPMAVGYSNDADGLILDEDGKPQVESIKYNQLTFLLIEEMKKLRARIEVLEG